MKKILKSLIKKNKESSIYIPQPEIQNVSEVEWREYGYQHGYSQYFTNKFLKEKNAELLALLKEALTLWEKDLDALNSELGGNADWYDFQEIQDRLEKLNN